MTKLILTEILLSFVLFATSSNALQFGKCPFVRPQANFDASGFLGQWYEYAKYPVLTESFTKCVTLEFEPLSDETYFIRRTLTGEKSQIQIGSTGTAALTQSGVFHLDVDGLGGVPGNSILSILGTDYTNFAVAFSCEDVFDFGFLHQQYAFVLTRKTEPSPEVVAAAKNVLQSNGLSVKNLALTDQLNCSPIH